MRDHLVQLSEAQSIQLDNSDIQTLKILPTRNLLEELEQSLVRSQQDSKAVISFSGYEFRKYQDSLYLLKPMLRKEHIADIRDTAATLESVTGITNKAVGYSA